MRALTVPEIVQLWETARRYHPLDRALEMLQAVLPDHSRDDLAALTLGQRDALLLSLRQATFGDLLPAISDCPACSGTIEFELRCSALLDEAAEPHRERLCHDGYSARIRPLNSFDLAAAAAAETVAQARTILLGRCVSDTCHEGEPIAPEALPREIQRRVAESALAADSRAEMLLELSCPDCQQHWRSALDIGRLLWLELRARAHRLMSEVHVLAKAYGWGEAEIIELSPERRAVYLRMASA